MRHSRDYHRYIRSTDWKWVRLGTIIDRGERCERCGHYSPLGRELDVHHLTYQRLGHERDEDLQVVCRPCHEVADAERRARVSSGLWDARVEGFASACGYHDLGEAERALEEWLGDD